MHFTSTILAVALSSTALASPLTHHGGRGNKSHTPDPNIFPDFNRYSDWAICKNKITKQRFPNLQAPNNDGGCVRYYRGIDITGVVTERHFFFRDGFRTACDCAAQCLENPTSCTNWVWKHTFMPGDDNMRSCTLYSSPNLPTDVTLAYNTNSSKGFALLQPGNNPQAGAPAPLTFLDAAGTVPDEFGVSGFMVQDQNGRQFC
ncbi:uncharacterized protein TRIVIDRAFT_68821 [Trichoderma virens Gv29-8]|uniref:Apple domain-containing protein n=1 Tax=Hypocrea virens (strain Gv29-8 / FGSC 10586) TaxID=413071 RepID=G9MZ63_HYPVG|nr:uncharacterized protein TRIVIDRAFT_68821 [Trichoderma virens Gv29-8]EHK20389.1 hypothetical protein TRIVIDRAFT_68821 [Trichoderma virens Gv29-8]UKZ47048.1 hypothetical protein TrVGV298_001260 [Trichoderma virens]UKZ73622.1 hypothetical protein TrVFT333_001270 [Trichoderma virens FT-333]